MAKLFNNYYFLLPYYMLTGVEAFLLHSLVAVGWVVVGYCIYTFIPHIQSLSSKALAF